MLVSIGVVVVGLLVRLRFMVFCMVVWYCVFSVGLFCVVGSVVVML